MVATRSISPDAIRQSTPSVRMRRNSTSQHVSVYERPLLSWVVQHHQLASGAALSAIVLVGTGVAYVLGLAQDTSNPFSLPPPSSFLRSKNNFLNQIFVKRAWGWTVSCVLSQIVTSPSGPRRPSTKQRVIALAMATSLWAFFALWFFCPGLGDRLISLTGGTCAIPVPASYRELSEQELQRLLPTEFSGFISLPTSSNDLFLPVGEELCNDRAVITRASHPMLFLASDSIGSSPLRARWIYGVDVSGHIWLLTLAVMRLAAEASEGWRLLFLSQGRVHNPMVATATLYTTVVLMIWIFMIFVTSIFFHREEEKLLALALGLLAAWATNCGASWFETSDARMPRELDENAARRLRSTAD